MSWPDGYVRKAIRDAAMKGLSITVIAKQVGLSKGTVDGLIRLMGHSAARNELG